MFRTIAAIILAIVWVIGSILPLIPWVILSLIALIIIELTMPWVLGSQTWIISVILIVLAMVWDYVLPIWWAKRSGWTKWSTYGSIIWLIVWLFVPPFGLIIWPLLGAFIGEYIIHQDSKHARRAARWSFVGSSLSLIIKVIASGMILYYVIQASL